MVRTRIRKYTYIHTLDIKIPPKEGVFGMVFGCPNTLSGGVWMCGDIAKLFMSAGHKVGFFFWVSTALKQLETSTSWRCKSNCLICDSFPILSPDHTNKQNPPSFVWSIAPKTSTTATFGWVQMSKSSQHFKLFSCLYPCIFTSRNSLSYDTFWTKLRLYRALLRLLR